MSAILLASPTASQGLHLIDISPRQVSLLTRLFLSEFEKHARASEPDQIKCLLEQYSQAIHQKSLACQIQVRHDPIQRKEALEDLRAARTGLRTLLLSPEVRNNSSLTSHVLTIETAILEIDIAIAEMEKLEAENTEPSLKGRKETSAFTHVRRQLSNNLLQQQAVNNQRMSAITTSNKETLKEIDRKKEQNQKDIHEFYSKLDEKARLDRAIAQNVPVSEIVRVY